jgi:RHS repeat-associated protein
LSGSLTATGGVGAVLASSSYELSANSYELIASSNYLYDGNGNVISTCDSKGEITAKLAYSPFGEKIDGPELAFGFSTKPTDSSGLSYYGFRFYEPEIGRWLSRDPIFEKSFNNDPMHIVITSIHKKHEKQKWLSLINAGYRENNEYRFVSNSPIAKYDLMGLNSDCVCPEGSKKGKKQLPPEENGCGPGWATWIPDDPMLILSGTLIPCNFTPSCNNHDRCYGTCGRSQLGCDADFFSNLSSSCYDCATINFGYSWINPLFYVYLTVCELATTTYAISVVAGGTASFYQAQSESCVDCCCD